MKGFLLIDKEKGMTSFDVIREVRRFFGEKRVGHAGTLDPLATGLLLVAVGREYTRKLDQFLKSDKEYEVEAKFGYISDSYDADGRVREADSSVTVSREAIERAIESSFLGRIQQVPPKYSALKIKGKRACDIVRQGGDVKLKPREIRIDEFRVLSFEWPKVKFCVKCGSGTYIRSLVHDLGQKLDCGAYVTALRRTKVGDYSVDDAKTLKELDVGNAERPGVDKSCQ